MTLSVNAATIAASLNSVVGGGVLPPKSLPCDTEVLSLQAANDNAVSIAKDNFDIRG